MTKPRPGKQGIANQSVPPGSVVPVLLYEDVGKAADWLRNTFGFKERLRAGNDHVPLSIGAGAVFLGRKRVGQGFDSLDGAEFRPLRPNEVSHYVHVKVEDVDRHYDHARQHGARPAATG